MSDQYQFQKNGIMHPAENAVAITPHDSNDLADASRGVFVGVSGNLKVDMVGSGTAVVFTGLAAGVIHPLRVTRIYSTDTTATNIVAVY